MTTVPRYVPLILVSIAQLFVLRVGGQEFKGRVEVRAIEITADVRDANGRVPRDLQPADFVVLENGIRQKTIGVAYADAPPPSPGNVIADRQVVIFIQQSLSSTQGLRLAITSLASEAESVVAAGEVVVASDYPRPHSLFGPTRDAAALRAFLRKLGNEITGQEELIRIRAAFAATDLPTESRNAEHQAEVFARNDQIRMRARHEWTTLRTREDALLGWLNHDSSGRTGPFRTLLLISDGFDLEPASFYRLDGGDSRTELRTELRSLSASPHHEEIARALAGDHWTVISLAMMAPPHSFTPSDFQSRTGDSIDAVSAAQKMRTRPINRYPLAPLARLAEATGGAVVTDVKNVGTQVREMSERVVITYQSDHPADATLRRIEISSRRPSLTIRAQRWSGTATAGAVAEAMAVSFATDVAKTGKDTARGELPVTCSISFGPVMKRVRDSELKAHVDLKPIEELLDSDEPGSLDFTIAVVSANDQPFTTTRRMEHVDLAAADGYTCTIAIRHHQNARIAVVASEPSTGSWGICIVDTAGHEGHAALRAP